MPYTKYLREAYITGKYVYHVSRPWNRESIMTNGLLASPNQYISNRPVVFANNNETPDWTWWPFPIDIYDWSLDHVEAKKLEGNDWIDYCMRHYDFWQIDAETLGRKWFVDPILDTNDEGQAYIGKDFNPYNYVICFGSIPPSMLKLYTYRPYKQVTDHLDNVASFRIEGGLIPWNKAA